MLLEHNSADLFYKIDISHVDVDKLLYVYLLDILFDRYSFRT